MTTSRIFRNASMLGAAQLFAMLAGLVSTAWVARVLGPEGFGILGFGTAFVSYFALLVVFATDFYGTREIASAPGRAGRVVAAILGVRLILLAGVSTAYLAAILIADRPETVAIVMTIQIVGLFSAAATFDYLFQSLQRFGPVAIRQAGASFAALICVMMLVDGPNDIYIAAAIPFSVMLASALLLASFAHRQVTKIGVSFDRDRIGEVFRASAPILVASFFALVYLNTDVVMLGFLRPSAEVGIYAGMSRLYLLSLFVGQIATTAFAPALAAAWPDRSGMRDVYLQHLRIAVFLGMPVCAAVVAFPDAAVGIVFGKAYLAGNGPLQILMLAAALAYLGMAANAALIAWRDQKAQALIFGIGAVVNVLLNLWMIPAYGGVGAAVATLLAQLIMTVFLLFRVRMAFGAGGLRRVGCTAAFAAFSFGIAWVAYRAIAPPTDGADFWVFPVLLSIGAGVAYIAFSVAAGIVALRELRALLVRDDDQEAAVEAEDETENGNRT